MNQRRLQYFIDTVSDLDMRSRKYYLVFSKSLNMGMVLNKHDNGNIFIITVLPRGKKQPKLMMVEAVLHFDLIEIE